MEKNFKNQIVAISGGLGDIGQAIAEAFAKRGAHIALCGMRSVDLSKDFVHRIQSTYSVTCLYNQVDVGSPQEITNWLNKIVHTMGVPSIVIPNAATVTVAELKDFTADEWVREIQVNLNGSFFFAQQASQLMINEGLKGHVVFIGSWAGHAVHKRMAAYCVSKAGLRMLCKCMALELAPHHILVNEVAPGYVMAGLSGKLFTEDPALSDQSKQKVPLKRIMRADAVAREVIHLCDPENVDVTGSTILIDGGLSLLT